MYQSSQLHPIGLSIPSHSFGGLQQVLDLGELGVGITLVDQGVELLDSFPDGHASSLLVVKLFTRLQVVIEGLFGVLFSVEFLVKSE